MFDTDWLYDPEFSAWLSGLPNDEFAYCKVCRKEVSVFYGRRALRVHGKGQRHLQLLQDAQRKRKATHSRKSVVESHKSSSTSDINVNVFNVVPSCSSVASELNQLVSSLGKNNISPVDRMSTPSSSTFCRSPSPRQPLTYLPRDRSPVDGTHISSSSFSRRSPAPDSYTYSLSSRRSPFPAEIKTFSPSPFVINTSSRWVEDGSEFFRKVDEMFAQQSAIIETDVSDLLKIFEDNLRYTLNDSASYQLAERCRTVKTILDDYTSQHQKLETNIKKRLLDALQPNVPKANLW